MNWHNITANNSKWPYKTKNTEFTKRVHQVTKQDSKNSNKNSNDKKLWGGEEFLISRVAMLHVKYIKNIYIHIYL